MAAGSGAAPAAGAKAVSLADVSVTFRLADGGAYTAVQGCTLDVADGEFVAIVGPTGCGKSTTLNLITGLARPTSGNVQVLGGPVSGVDPRVGFVFQADALFPWRNVLDNVSAGPRFRGRPRAEAEADARAWIQRVGLAGFERHYPHQLSGGMRKRCALAQTFINGPEVLLMDEPFSALDVQTRVVMQDALLRLWETTGASVVFVTHDIEEAIGLADRVYVLTARPATVKAVYSIELPRPRVLSEIRYDPRFVELSRVIWNDLRHDAIALA